MDVRSADADGVDPDTDLACAEGQRRRFLDAEPSRPVEHELAHEANLYDGVPGVQVVSGMTYDRPMEEAAANSRPSDPLFAQVERQPRLSDKVAQMMLDTILSRRLAAGDRLPSERELGDQFGVSRTVIREAVRALVAKGVIEVRSGSGLRVAAVDASTVHESMSLFLRGGTLDYEKVHEVRKMLEVHIAGLAAERASEDDLRRLTEACESMEQAVADVDEAALRDLEFHRVIARATHNELYLVLMDSIGQSLISVRRENLGAGNSAQQTLRMHRDILERIAAHDVDGSRRAMSVHLDDVEDTWKRLHANATASA
jgi:GntR family transcriptional repressor for pyruvate dehydrogenase complex